MSKKHILDMLSGYFDELLDDTDDSLVSSDNSVATDIDDKPKIIKQNQITNNETFEHPIPKKEASSNKEGEKTQVNSQSDPRFPPKSYKTKLQDNQFCALNVKKNVEVSRESTVEVIPPASDLADASEKLKPVMVPTDYEQHKQRLEKMLQQVTSLNGRSQLASPSVDMKTDSSTDEVIKTNIITDKDEILSELVSYPSLPPLTSKCLENNRPSWAQEQFDILIIEVNGVKLALPLMALGQIYPLEDNLTSLFGQSDWLMGLQKTSTGYVKTVNTAKFVMPERYEQEHNYQYVVSINGSSWGLAVDFIHQPINIDSNHIRWRRRRDNRPWMAGMVTDHMCVLLDIPAMEEILQEHDKNSG